MPFHNLKNRRDRRPAIIPLRKIPFLNAECELQAIE